ncbi:TRAP transporter small permease [Roseomonas sp. BN140053]|uniref:TRAP transporter small permease n=1 Tax=Roseomonas sp. BN140053 TaxID=3391898 RepID=UPI0039EAE2A6
MTAAERAAPGLQAGASRGTPAVAERLGQAAEALGTLAFAAIFLIFLAGIVARYLLDEPLFWSDEMAMIVFVWATFWTDSFVTRERDHVAFDILWDASSPRGRRIIGIAQCVIFGVIFVAAVPAVLDYVLFLKRERTAALEWRLDAVFSCFVLYMVSVVVRLLVKLRRLLRADWQRCVMPEDHANTTNVIG